MTFETRLPMPDPEQQWRTIAEWLGAGSINLFGLPFAGKDTQGQYLAEQLDAPLIGGGDILRNTDTFSAAGRQQMEQGGLAPKDEFLQIVTPYLSQEQFNGKPLVLSSLGRWQGEEQAIFDAAAQAGHPIRAALVIGIDAATMRTRWQASQADDSRGARADDDAHKLDTRLNEFTVKTGPVLDFYRQRGLLLEVDGRASTDAVAVAIRELLFARAAA